MLFGPVRLVWTLVMLCICALVAAPAQASGNGAAVREAPGDSEHQPGPPSAPVNTPDEEDDTGGEDDVALPTSTHPRTPHARPLRRARPATPPPPNSAAGTLFRPPERA